MFRKLMLPALATTLVLAACAESPTAVQTTTTADDYALVVFGTEGSSLEGTMGTQPSGQATDGRTGGRQLPDSLALTQTQKDSIQVLRTAFRTANRPALDSLHAIFQQARTARQGGATREEVRAILVTGRPIAEALRPLVHALHVSIRAVFTDAQRAWLDANRPPMPGLMAPGGR